MKKPLTAAEIIKRRQEVSKTWCETRDKILEVFIDRAKEIINE
jgi:hypothetical protein